MAAGARNRFHKPAEAATPRRSGRRRQTPQADDIVPDVFLNLLQEGEASKTASADEDARPLKKRKTTQKRPKKTRASISPVPTSAKRRVHETAAKPLPQPLSKTPVRSKPSQLRAHSPVPSEHEPENAEVNGRVRQTIIDSDESESDMEWEDALAEGNDTSDDEGKDVQTEIGDVAITFGENAAGEGPMKKRVRRRAITSVDKKRRLDIHKMHILCLLYHVHRRNAWCNDRRVHAIMRNIPSPRLLSNLVPNPEYSQYHASQRFTDGMNGLKLMWSKRFSVTAQGMYRPRWAEADADVRPYSDFDELDDPMDLDDFRTLAVKLEGSQDVGTQLFCALLRAIGVEARLVCSLQCLPFASSAQPATPQKPSPHKNTVVLDPYNTSAPSPPRPRARGTASRMKRPSRLEEVLGERHPKLSTIVAPKKKYHASYPVYWVEVFNPAHQKWASIDVLSTFTYNFPEKLEPPLSFSQNSLTYAIAFEDDYTAKDVTGRYAKAFNAKTRKFRIESTAHGGKWWKRTMKFFERSRPLDRDQIEDTALARKIAGEGIPKNVQDFKSHPIYVLERHLRYNEVIHPMNQVGKVNVGSSMNPKMEIIYRRENVHIVRSADKWYRMGRDVQDGEQPLKNAKPKKNRRMSIGPEDLDDQQEEVGVGLYAEFQTNVYEAPPVVRGRVPRNAYGNLDLYVPSMCPPGGTHIRHKLASKAARILSVDYAEAVTGFNFKGRHGTAVVQGVVVADEYTEAVEAVIDGMIYAQEEAENMQRSSEALRLWRRFYLGLRIAQRINNIEIDGQKGETIDVQQEIEKADKVIAEKEFAGGFFPDEGETTQPTARNYELSAEIEEYAGGFMLDEEDDDGGGDGGGFVPDIPDINEGNAVSLQHTDSFGSAILSQQKLRPQRTNSFGGGFMLEEDDFEDYAGFSRDPNPTASGPSTKKPRPAGAIETTDKHTTDHVGGGFIPETEPQTNTGGGFIPEVPSPVNDHDAFSPIAAGEDTSRVPQAIKSTTATTIRAPNSQSPPPQASPPSDAGSLLLEDPDDEDADPDWLVDAT
jgi:xeroderma pigmentosum group C-complementing protein